MNEQLGSSARVPPADLAPQSPALAFERFIELVRNSSAMFDADPQTVLRLLRPFLVNPNRDEPHVKEMVEAYSAALVYSVFRKLPLWKYVVKLSRAGRRTMEQYSPKLITRLRELEAVLRTELRPGSIALHLKPARYLDSPTGFGAGTLLRYRVQVQTLIESAMDDALQAVSVEIVLTAANADLVVDDMSPGAGFSTVGVKQSAGLQVGRQQTATDKVTSGAEISGVGVKVSAGAESQFSEQSSTLVTMGGEKTSARVEQYLFARRIANRAIWRALAGVGPVDAAGAEYTADVLVPAGVDSLDIRVEARVEWLRAGVVPAEMRRTISLPRPAIAAGG